MATQTVEQAPRTSVLDAAWLRRIALEAGRRKIRLSGPPRLLIAFGRCFPS